MGSKKGCRIRRNKGGRKRFKNTVKRKNKVYSGPIFTPSKINTNPFVSKNNLIRIDEALKNKNSFTTLNFLFSNKNTFSPLKAEIPKNGILKIPRIFSLLENPGESFIFLKTLLHTFRYPNVSKIIFDYQD